MLFDIRGLRIKLPHMYSSLDEFYIFNGGYFLVHILLNDSSVLIAHTSPGWLVYLHWTPVRIGCLSMRIHLFQPRSWQVTRSIKFNKVFLKNLVNNLQGGKTRACKSLSDERCSSTLYGLLPTKKYPGFHHGFIRISIHSVQHTTSILSCTSPTM